MTGERRLNDVCSIETIDAATRQSLFITAGSDLLRSEYTFLFSNRIALKSPQVSHLAEV